MLEAIVFFYYAIIWCCYFGYNIYRFIMFIPLFGASIVEANVIVNVNAITLYPLFGFISG